MRESETDKSYIVLVFMLVALLAGLLAPDSAQGQLRGPVRNLTADTTPAAGDMLLVDKATPLVSRKLTLHALAGYLMTDPDLVPATRTITCTPPLLCAGGTSMDLSVDRTLALSPATLTAVSQGAVSWLTSGSTATGATNEGTRPAMFSLFDTNTSANNTAAMTMDCIARTPAGTIIRTCLHVKSYTPPDNGGDTSGILAVSTGGSTGATIAKLHGLRPATYTDYGTSSQPALEVHTSDEGAAIQAIAGSGIGGTPYPSQVMIMSLGQPTGASQSGGPVVQPLDGVFDGRDGITIGTASLGARPVNVHFQVLMNGNLSSSGTGVFSGALSASNLSGTNTGDQVVPVNTTATSHQFFTAYNSATGAYTKAQPDYGDLTGTFWSHTSGNTFTTTSTDKVGIGVSTPDSPIEISTNAAALPTPLSGASLHVGQVDSGTGPVFASDTFIAAGTFAVRRSNGTAASPSALNANDIIANFAAYGYGTSAYGSTPGSAIRLSAEQAYTNTAQGSKIDFLTDDINTTTPTTKWSISAMGHLTHTQTTAPTVACTGTGTSPSAPTIDTGGTDHQFTVVINTGTGSPGSTGTCTITFATAFPAVRPIVCMLVKGATAWGNSSTIMETTESASAPIFTWTNIASGTPTALTTSTSYKFSCVGDF